MADFLARKAVVVQLDRRKPMAEARKLQKDMENTLKKCQEGLVDLETAKAKATAASQAEVLASISSFENPGIVRADQSFVYIESICARNRNLNDLQLLLTGPCGS